MSNQWEKNWLKTRDKVGWVEPKSATPETYSKIGFKCGLEVHQQLATSKKLFCRCPAGIFHDFDDYDAEIVRHMRPTLSELGEYDGTALMEFKTKKKIVYRIKNDTACTYEVDDTPPFVLNPEALSHAMEIALLLKMNIVGELHITRKQYLDGSIPTGFQRTTILGIEGEIPISNKNIKLIQFSIEEDSCREVSDYRHTRVYYADRLGMPLIETVTYPEMLTPQEAAEAGQYIRFLARSSGKARTGIGAARQDVNVSVTGGTRIEIKGVSHITWIPKLTHNEAFRQCALLKIKDELNFRKINKNNWKIKHTILNPDEWKHIPLLKKASADNWQLIAVNLPDFRNLLSYFTQPGKSFADEFSDRMKVIPCLEKPNLFHSEQMKTNLKNSDWDKIREVLSAKENDAQILFWAPEEDVQMALDTIQERGIMAFEGVPNETRKALDDGTTIFERVLPGADRMYPDTDSKPISISNDMIENARKKLPVDLHDRLNQLKEWKVPVDAYTYILRNNLMPDIELISKTHNIEPKKIALLYAHKIKSLHADKALPFSRELLSDLIKFLHARNLCFDIIYEMIPILYENPNMIFSSVLSVLNFNQLEKDKITDQIPVLQDMYVNLPKKSKRIPDSELAWIMGRLRKIALGNMPLRDLHDIVLKHISSEVNNA
jgi:glutamyl-tRNA(Gln) amidotransferase subunit E